MSEDPPEDPPAPSRITVNGRWGVEYGVHTDRDTEEAYQYALFNGFAQQTFEVEAPEGFPVPTPILPNIGDVGLFGDLELPFGIEANDLFGSFLYMVENQTYDYDYYGKANIARFTVEYKLSAQYALIWEPLEGPPGPTGLPGEWVQGPLTAIGGAPDWENWEP